MSPSLEDLISRVQASFAPRRFDERLMRDVLRALTERRGSPAELRAERNARLRQAAEFVEGSLWRKARRLEAAIRALTDPNAAPPADDSDCVGPFIREALEIDPEGCPRSLRQILRVLE